METVRLVTAVASSKGWKMSQMDVKSAFLNGPLKEEVYIVQPPGFEKEGRKHLVYRLRKALYGLKQAPRAWNKLIDAVLAKLGFVKCTVEFGVYVKRTSHANTLIVCLYVDDLIITGSVEEEIEEFKGKMKIEFEMTDLGTLSYFLGLEFVHTHKGVFLHQKKYAHEILKRFQMERCNEAAVPVLPGLKLTEEKEAEVVDGTLYKQIVGSLRFLCNSRPDLSFGVGLISRFMHDPRTPHMAAAKHILRYLKGTTDWGIFFPKADEQNEIVLEINKSAINLSRNPTLHGRSKHIDTKFHFLRDQVSRGKLTLLYCRTEEQTADVFTKPLKQARFDKLRKQIGMSSLEFLD